MFVPHVSIGLIDTGDAAEGARIRHTKEAVAADIVADGEVEEHNIHRQKEEVLPLECIPHAAEDQEGIHRVHQEAAGFSACIRRRGHHQIVDRNPYQKTEHHSW
jgi:hypothetical protein